MVQKINPNLAPGCNRSPPTMYFQKMQFLGVFRPFLQRSLPDPTTNYETMISSNFYIPWKKITKTDLKTSSPCPS